AAPPPPVDAAAPPPPATDVLSCPECGTTALVTLNRRQAQDFCRHCDYPLFWTPSAVVLGGSGVGEESLRRLPGTTGRAMTASVACPHCAEPNPVTAAFCVRCGLSMQVRHEAPPPPPAPVYTPPPPEPVLPDKRVPWWVWLIIGLLMTGAIVVGVLFATGTLG